jgi:hypothetical protein
MPQSILTISIFGIRMSGSQSMRSSVVLLFKVQSDAIGSIRE